MASNKYTHFDEIFGTINQKNCSAPKRTLVGAVITVIGMIVVIILVTGPSKINSGKTVVVDFDLKIHTSGA